MAYRKRQAKVSFGDFSFGVNTNVDPLSIRTRQVQSSLDVMLRKRGTKIRPAANALENTSFVDYLWGLHAYLQLNGTDRLLAFSDDKLYEINKSTGAKTERYDFGDSGETFFSDYLDKCWIANGVSVVKLEDTTAYRVGIAAPSGASAAVQDGGTLPDDTYNVYVSYARKISGSNVLYSAPESLGSVTTSGSNNTVRVTCANSSDAQVYVYLWLWPCKPS